MSKAESSLNIWLFGPLRVEVHGQPLPALRSRRGLWLLALLTLRANRQVARTWLAGTLWPDSDDGQALDNLKRALTDLRKALGDSATLLQSPTRHTLLFALPPENADVLAFDAALQNGTKEALVQATALYTGPLLEDCYELWASPEQESRKEAFLNSVERLATLETAPGELPGKIELLRRALRIDPSRENLTRLLMESLIRSGEPVAAAETYRALRLLLLEEHNASPPAEITALYTSLHSRTAPKAVSPPRSETAVPPASDSRPARTVHLPRAVTELIGRQEEVRVIRERLENCCLLTLTGAGGIGKTRLAVEAARQSQSAYLDGVWFLDLAPLGDPTQLVQTAASCLGVHAEIGRSLSEVLTDYLRPRSLLLIFDNCEHLLDACADMTTQLLRDCPDIRILTTSRQSLGVMGEVTYAVPALETPPSALTHGKTETDKGLLAVLMEYEAVRLFVERAQAVSATFRLTAQNAAAVIEICRHLDGIPLAIELAAGRVKALSVEDILKRLDNRFGLLTGGNRAAMPHHKTLRSMVDWSHDLLTDSEKVLLRRLSVFAGGWTLAGAEQVCSCEGTRRTGSGRAQEIERDDILDLLTSLIDKSLVTVLTPEGRTRYQMLETIRQYAAEKLEASGERESVRMRHAHFLTQIVAKTLSELKDGTEVELLARLEAEHDNLRAALHWSLLSDETAETALELCGAWGPFWTIQDNLSEGWQWCRAALDRTSETEAGALRVRVLNTACRLGTRICDFSLAHAFATESVALAKRIGDQSGASDALHGLGSVEWRQGRFPEALELLTESLALARAVGSALGMVHTLNTLAIISRDTGNHAKAKALYEESLQIAREYRNRRTIANCLNGLGSLLSMVGETQRAREVLEEGLLIQRSLNHRSGIMSCLYDLGMFESKMGHHTVAQQMLDEAPEIAYEIGEKIIRVHICLYKGLIACHQNLLEEAERWTLRGLTAERESLSIGERSFGLYILATIVRDQGDYARATELAQECLASANQNRDNNSVFGCSTLLSNIAYLQNDLEQADKLLCAGVERRQKSGEMGDIGDIVDAIEGFACLSLAKGQVERSQTLLAAALHLRQKCDWVTWRWGDREPLRKAMLEQLYAPTLSPSEQAKPLTLELAYALYQPT